MTKGCFVWMLVLGAALVALVGYCRKPLSPSDPRWISGLVDRVTPPGAVLLAGPDRNFDEFTLRASWDFETAQTWQTYSGWAGSRLRVDSWAARPARPSELVYGKALPGDSLVLTLERLSPGPPLRIRATFTASPD